MINNRPLIQAVGLETSEYVEESRSERKTGYRWMSFVIRKVNFGISCKRLYLRRPSAQTSRSNRHQTKSVAMQRCHGRVVVSDITVA